MHELNAQHVASGTVVDGDRIPVADAEVSGLWRRYCKDITLGTAQSDARGDFRLELDLPEEFPLNGRIVLQAVKRSDDSQTSSAEAVRLMSRKLDQLDGVELRFGFNGPGVYTF